MTSLSISSLSSTMMGSLYWSNTQSSGSSYRLLLGFSLAAWAKKPVLQVLSLLRSSRLLTALSWRRKKVWALLNQIFLRRDRLLLREVAGIHFPQLAPKGYNRDEELRAVVPACEVRGEIEDLGAGSIAYLQPLPIRGRPLPECKRRAGVFIRVKEVAVEIPHFEIVLWIAEFVQQRGAHRDTLGSREHPPGAPWPYRQVAQQRNDREDHLSWLRQRFKSPKRSCYSPEQIDGICNYFFFFWFFRSRETSINGIYCSQNMETEFMR